MRHGPPSHTIVMRSDDVRLRADAIIHEGYLDEPLAGESVERKRELALIIALIEDKVDHA